MRVRCGWQLRLVPHWLALVGMHWYVQACEGAAVVHCAV